MSDKSPPRRRGLRGLSNLLALAGLLLAADAAAAWWQGTSTRACGALALAGSENAMGGVGMTGILAGLAGVMLGGARHPLTGLGVLLLIGGVLGAAFLPELANHLCGFG